MKTCPLILAAGKGTRMKSDLPKVLHQVNGVPMVKHVIEAAYAATGQQPVLVIGHGAELVRQAVGDAASYVLQSTQLGTGHAVQAAEAALRGRFDQILVTYGDMPLLQTNTIRKLIEAQAAHDGPITMLTVVAEDPRGFGRIVRSPDGSVGAIVEEVVAPPEVLAIRELNPGVYCFREVWLWDALKEVPLSPKGEYYLTDLVEIAVKSGGRVQAIVVDDPREVIGVNTLDHLAEVEAALRSRMTSRGMGIS